MALRRPVGRWERVRALGSRLGQQVTREPLAKAGHAGKPKADENAAGERGSHLTESRNESRKGE